MVCTLHAPTLQTVTFYDSRGEFVGVRRLGSGNPIQVEGLTIRPQVCVCVMGCGWAECVFACWLGRVAGHQAC